MPSHIVPARIQWAVVVPVGMSWLRNQKLGQGRMTFVKNTFMQEAKHPNSSPKARRSEVKGNKRFRVACA